ncbi:MAG: hypothetical protein EBY15_00340 [Gammaproteobacteria bacterium]|nr:hypothetical protein [Gammaproteobacteria bacterium]
MKYTILFLAMSFLVCSGSMASPSCPSLYAPGSKVVNPENSRSRNGVLETTLVAHNKGDGPLVGSYDYQFCLLENNDPLRSSPVLSVEPGDQVKIHLNNRMQSQDGFPSAHFHSDHPCSGVIAPHHLDASNVNLHYHGLNVTPQCGGDNVLDTIVDTADGKNNGFYDYAIRIPNNEPPGLYWVHPHVHGVAQQHLLGGMSTLLIVEGMDNFYPELKEMKQKVLVIRDLDKRNPADMDSPDPNEPWKNLTVNSVPVIFGQSEFPQMYMKPRESQFWRVANASADTHLVLEFQVKSAVGGWDTETLKVLAMDGVPFIDTDDKKTRMMPMKSIVLPPGGRAEFVVRAPKLGSQARFYTKDYNAYLEKGNRNCSKSFKRSKCDSTDRNPARTLAQVQISNDPVVENEYDLVSTTPIDRFASLAGVSPDQSRRLFFSKDPRDDGDFFITVAGNTPQPFDPESHPDIVVNGPTVEDWTIENRDNESHDFHIHQTHFAVVKKNNSRVKDESIHILRDTIQIGSCRKWAYGVDPEDDPYGLDFPPTDPRNDPQFTGKNCLKPASVTLRIDFRDRDIVGKTLYHCHILEHEDKGMMRLMEIH